MTTAIQTIPTRAEFTAALREQDDAENAWRDYLRRLQRGETRPGEVAAIDIRCHEAQDAVTALVDRLPS